MTQNDDEIKFQVFSWNLWNLLSAWWITCFQIVFYFFLILTFAFNHSQNCKIMVELLELKGERVEKRNIFNTRIKAIRLLRWKATAVRYSGLSLIQFSNTQIKLSKIQNIAICRLRIFFSLFWWQIVTFYNIWTSLR